MSVLSSAAADAGVFTAEGNAAGAFAAALASQRAASHADFEKKKASIAQAAAAKSVKDLGDKFSTSAHVMTVDSVGDRYGLSHLGDAKVDLAASAAAVVAPPPASGAAVAAPVAAASKRRRGVLSFESELDGGDDDAPAIGGRGRSTGGSRVAAAAAPVAGGAPAADLLASVKLGKDPSVNTAFLPDRGREAAEAALRESLRAEFLAAQEATKKEKLEIVYSYWDGTGHRRTITVPKGTTIGKFLEWVRQDLIEDFPEMRNVSGDQLIYVKEDLLIPQAYSFYDLIATKARGKSGPLFHFDVHDDVRAGGPLDVRVEKDESHPGKVVERRWYERNKHIFPASRWEIYDPSVKRDRYTVHGDEVVPPKK